MSFIGKYNLLQSRDGYFAAEWFVNNKRQTIILPNFVEQLSYIVKEERGKKDKLIKHFVSIFELAFGGNQGSFLDHSDAIIMDFIDPNDCIPSSKLSGDQLTDFSIKRFLLAYNRWKNTFLVFSDVKSLCKTILSNNKTTNANE